jgi:hypothetical protein
MDKEEALLHLPLDQHDDLEDIYDERLYDLRQFFILNVPTSKVFNAKIVLLEKIQSAYAVLGGGTKNAPVSKVEMLDYSTDVVRDLVRIFHENSSKLKTSAIGASTVPELISVANRMLENMRSYASCWKLELPVSALGIKITQPSDSVELLIELERLNKSGFSKTGEISQLNSESLVYKEAIRLSLWNKLERNV